MEDVILISMSRQAALGRTMDVIANNLANQNTTGFKSEQMVFDEYLMPVEEKSGAIEATHLSFVIDRGLLRDFSDGRLEETGSPLDFAISGPGLFTVETDDGLRYTRNGNFHRDTDGLLVTGQGHPVLDEDGTPIRVDAEQAFDINSDGSFTDADGAFRKLGIVTFASLADMKKGGNGLLETQQEPEPVEVPQVIQGSLETSNVVAIKEMSRMIDVSRSYQSAARLSSDTHEQHTDAIRRLGATES